MAGSRSSPIEAVTLVPAQPDDVFAFLADLENHWRVADRLVEVLDLERDGDGRACGGRVRLRGPLGLRRTAATRLAALRERRLIIGVAELDEETRARVSWTLAGRLNETRVRLAAEIETAAPLDRALLLLGGRQWLERRFAGTLERLAQHFAADREHESAPVPVDRAGPE